MYPSRQSMSGGAAWCRRPAAIMASSRATADEVKLLLAAPAFDLAFSAGRLMPVGMGLLGNLQE